MNRLTLSRLWKFLRNAVAAVCGLVLVIALLPSKARSQLGLDPCCAMMQVGLNTISGLLRNAVAQPLGSIQQSQQQSANYEQQVVFPLTAITQARNMAVQFQSQFVQMRQLFQLPVKSGDSRKPRLESSILFYGRRGGLEMELWGKDVAFRGTVCPVFYTRAGERLVLPNDFQDAATRITSAVCCLGCRHCHLLGPRLTDPARTENPNALDVADERRASVDAVADGAA